MINKILKRFKLVKSGDPTQKPAEQQTSATFTQAYYSSVPVLPFSQSPALLSNWLSTNHPEYNMSSWCFYGNIETDNLGTIAINSIVQQQFSFPENQPPYIAEFSFCQNNGQGYNLAPFMLYDTSDIQFSIPFNIQASLLRPNKIESIGLSLVSGNMGEKGAQYKMSGVVIDFNLVEWKYEVLLTDTTGAIQVGYGPSSFLPQWLTAAQQKQITSNYNNSVHDYLEKTGDTMEGQGSYYYSLPLLTLNSFTLLKDGVPYTSGTKGNIWVDYVVQGFADQSWPILEEASWQFFAIQFPSTANIKGINAALMVSIVTTKQNGVSNSLPVARFYDGSSSASSAQNGSIQASFEWNMNEIEFKPTKYWTDAKGKKFPVAFELILKSPNGTIAVWAQAAMDNQVVSEVEKYEGVYQVIAAIQVNGINEPFIKGYAWAEVH
jgi:hypothetical protein